MVLHLEYPMLHDNDYYRAGIESSKTMLNQFSITDSNYIPLLSVTFIVVHSYYNNEMSPSSVT